ncbi:hypothetical protein [Streptomyces formicae]|uniref:Uncharacterized protein n=1 Tax=Streptomyces formicae TaxID=1616117 RepID=A0A291QLE0_9ACTN|nr:hypothetical protein [Streptomyces formicae]ATL32265.1 hypothetical protein KY5_7247c [Streptomyces formicae]
MTDHRIRTAVARDKRGRNRLQDFGEGAAVLTWWVAVLTGFGLLGLSVRQDLTDQSAQALIPASVPDTAVEAVDSPSHPDSGTPAR